MTAVSYDPDEPMPGQERDWSCAACSLAWLYRATSVDACNTEDAAIACIGYPEQINETYGLMDGSGARLSQLLRGSGIASSNLWATWSQTVALAQRMPLLIGGVSWYHWVGVRSAGANVLFLANSAPGWMSIYDSMQEHEWNALGPFAVVTCPLSVLFPPLE
jgi:hypothetical protein